MKLNIRAIKESKAPNENNFFVIEQHFMFGKIEIDATEKGAILIWNCQEVKEKKPDRKESEEKTVEVVFIQNAHLENFIRILKIIAKARKT